MEGHFAPQTFHAMDVSPHGHFTPKTIRPMWDIFTLSLLI